jgi:general secretion pathway protein N
MENPLWAVPLSALSETNSRPLFSPSRRPPLRLVTTMPSAEPVRSPAKEPDHPMLSLLGTIVGSSKGIAVVLDQTSNGVIRLWSGQAHAGWVLRSVGQRVASFEKDGQTATLALPALGAKEMAGTAPERPGGARAGICADNQIAGSSAENCVRSGPPGIPVAKQTSANSRKKRWHDALEAAAARRAR